MLAAAAALVGLGYLSVASAVPFPVGTSSSAPPAVSIYGGVLPLANGFPDIQNPSSELTAIEEQAHGTLPNVPLPPTLAPDDLTSLRLIAFTELIEVAYFTEILHNVTNNVADFNFTDPVERQTVIDALTAIQAQEELHLLQANYALEHYGQEPMKPCRYHFNITNFGIAMTLATTLNDVVMGSLQDIQAHMAMNGDPGMIASLGGVIAQEGEQNGFFRNIIGRIPSAVPFISLFTRELTYSILVYEFIIPGSCPNMNLIDLPITPPLSIITTLPVKPHTQTLEFSVKLTDGHTFPDTGASLVYLSQHNVPIVESIQNIQHNGDIVSFAAEFPYDENVMNGLTSCVVAMGNSFPDAASVSKAAVFGPQPIEIN